MNQYNKEENSERLEKSKAEVTQEMGYTRHEVSDYQRMAQNLNNKRYETVYNRILYFFDYLNKMRIIEDDR